MSGHTPGPWTAVCNDVVGARPVGDDGIRYVEVVAQRNDPYRGAICGCHDAQHINGISLAERDANARLIAAAPELLEALKSVVADIAKTEGDA